MPLLTITQSFWEYLGPVCNACFSMLFILCTSIFILYVFLYFLSNHLIIICHHLSRLSRSVSPGPMRMFNMPASTWNTCSGRLASAQLGIHRGAPASCACKCPEHRKRLDVVLHCVVFCNNSTTFLGKHLTK